MLTIIIQFSFSFIASAAYAVITNVPKSSLIGSGLTGAAGWMSYWIILQLGGNEALSSLVGSLMVAMSSYYFSKKLKMPVTIFNIPGMVPLVPGGLAYQAVRNLVSGDYKIAMDATVQSLMIAGAIALGLVLSEVFNHNIRSFREKREIINLIRKKEKG